MHSVGQSRNGQDRGQGQFRVGQSVVGLNICSERARKARIVQGTPSSNPGQAQLS
jgi:hypothetical protein